LFAFDHKQIGVGGGTKMDVPCPCVGAEIKACLISNGLPLSHRTQRALPSVRAN
jgi:hypothetical protein